MNRKLPAEAAFLADQLESRIKRLKSLGMEEGLSELFYSLNGSEVRVIINTLPEMSNSQFNIFFDLIAEEIKVIKNRKNEKL